MPLSRAACQVFRQVGHCGLDVIALGPGDGRLETRFLAHLAARGPAPVARFYLLDISQPLLAEAYRHASAALGAYPGIAPIAILGDFHDLPQYGQLSDQNPCCPRPKVLLLIGGTFGNLDHEVRFLRDSLCGFPPGTLLLIDYPLCFAPANQPELVRARDPWLALDKDRVAWQERVMQFWTGPFRRYLPGFTGVTVHMELSSLPPEVPGSYSIEAIARVLARGAPDREFSLFRLRRYETSGLLGAARECGWDAVDGWPYGTEVDYPRALALLRKRAPPSTRHPPDRPPTVALGSGPPRGEVGAVGEEAALDRAPRSRV